MANELAHNTRATRPTPCAYDCDNSVIALCVGNLKLCRAVLFGDTAYNAILAFKMGHYIIGFLKVKAFYEKEKFICPDGIQKIKACQFS